MTGTNAGQLGARFRPKLPDRKVVDEWSWYENDFLTTQPFRNLVVVNLILNNWDWKTSNNKVYQIPGSDGGPLARVYVVQDLGASLGKTAYPRALRWLPMTWYGTRLTQQSRGLRGAGVHQTPKGARVTFDYRGIHPSLLDLSQPATY